MTITTPHFPQHLLNNPQLHTLFSFLVIHQIQLVLPICIWVWGHKLEHGKPVSGHNLEEWFFLPSQLSAANRSTVKGWVLETIYPTMLGFGLAWSWDSIVEISLDISPMPKGKTAIWPSYMTPGHIPNETLYPTTEKCAHPWAFLFYSQ